MPYTHAEVTNIPIIELRKRANLHIIPIPGYYIALADKDLIQYFTIRKKYMGNFIIIYRHHPYQEDTAYVDIKETKRVNKLYEQKRIKEAKEAKQQAIEDAKPHLEMLKQAKANLMRGTRPNYEGFDHSPLERAYGYRWLNSQHIPFTITNDIAKAMEIKVLYEKIINILPEYKVTMREKDAAIIIVDFNDKARGILRDNGIKYTAMYGCQNQYGRASYGRKYPVDINLAKEILNELALSSKYMDIENGKVVVYLPRCYDTEVEHIIKGWTGVRGHMRHLANGKMVHVRPHVRAIVEKEYNE